VTEFPAVSARGSKIYIGRMFGMKNVRFAMVLTAFVFLLPLATRAQWAPLNPVMSVQKQVDGVLATMRMGVLRVEVCADSIIHVTYAPRSPIPDVPQYIVTKTHWPAAQWNMEATDAAVTLETSSVKIMITRQNGAIRYEDSTGKKLFEDGGRTLTPVEVNGEKTYRSEMHSNLWDSTEAFYGLGQHQAGVWNYHGEFVDLLQDNTNISVPFFISSNGYGILWNNTSRSHFNNRFLHALYALVSNGEGPHFVSRQHLIYSGTFVQGSGNTT
jgi:alpha-D-xyloside xylohydrolase